MLDSKKSQIPGIKNEDIREYAKGKELNSFDIVVCKNVIHYGKDFEECKEIFDASISLLKKGGLMYLVVRNEEHNDEKYRFSDQKLKNVLGKNEYGPLNRINANTEVFIKRTE